MKSFDFYPPLGWLPVLAVATVVTAGCSSTPSDAPSDDTTPVAQPGDPSTSTTSDSSVADTRGVITAAVDIEAGTALEKSDIEEHEVPAEFLPANPLLIDDLSIYLGQPVTESIHEGDMLLTSDFATTETATSLASRIPDGERVLTIPGDAIQANTILVEPGDRIDILGTFPIKAPIRDEEEGDMMTLPLLQNVTVLATGSCLSDIDDTCDGDGGIAISVTPDEAEFLTVTRHHGELTILLRNPEDATTVPVTRNSLRNVLENLELIQHERDERTDEMPNPRNGR